MNKLKFILAASIAASLTLSCSNGDDEGSSDGSGPNTKVYSLVEKKATEFTYMEEDTYEYCDRGGILKTEEDNYKQTINYSIKNNIMTWQDANYYEGDDIDTLNFKGNSNDLIGTWTRTKNKATSCKLRTDSDGDSWYRCKSDYDIVEAAFTQTTVKITRDECWTEQRIMDGGNFERTDWKERAVDCNTVEIYKGSEKVTWRVTRNSQEVSYKGKTCKMSEPTKAQKEKACKEAWNKYQDEDYYWDLLEGDFEDCIKRTLPEELWGDDHEIELPPPPPQDAKAKAKAKFTPLLKKKN